MIVEHIITKTPIDKGWSGDKKYRAVTSDGQVYLLRVAAPERAERKMREFAQMQRVAALGIPMCLPIEIGTCAEGVYSLQSFIEGEDAGRFVVLLNCGHRGCAV